MTQPQGTVKIIKKKKKKKRLTPFVKLLCFIVLGFSAFLLYEVAKEMYTTVQLREQLVEVEEKYQKIKEENEYLVTEKEKLTDPNYVQTYARGNYMLSKDGEQIFYLPEKDE